MVQRVLWFQAKQDIDVGQAGISIKQANLVATGCQGNSQVDRGGSLADTTFTTGYRDDPGRILECLSFDFTPG